MDDLALFYRRLHTMLDAGISLPDALDYLEKGEPSAQFRKVIGDCLKGILGGQTLSAGMRLSPHVFSPMTTEMIASAENTGSLATTLGNLASLAERQQERRHKVLSALAYPCCLFLVMLGVVVIFVVFVAPGDDGLFATLGDDIPWPSQVLIGLSEVLTSPVLMSLGVFGLVGVGLAVRQSYRTKPHLRRRVDEAMLNAPVLGRLVVRLEGARVLDVLTSSLRIGLSVVKALHNGARVSVNSKFREDLQAALGAIAQGSGVGQALADHTRFPRYVTSMIEVGEESGQLEIVLERASATLDDEANTVLGQLVSLAEPLLLSLGGLAAGFVAVATFLPILRLISNL